MRIMQHPLGSRVPGAVSCRTLQTPRILARGEDFVPLMRRPEDPTRLEDYLRADTPMLGLHVVSFADATLVTLRGSPLLFDAVGGRKVFLDAWSLTLQGRDDEVAPPPLMERDPKATLGAPTPEETDKCSALPVEEEEEYKYARLQLGPRQFLKLGLRQVLDRISHWRRRPVEEARIVCVPKPYLESLKKAALREWLEETYDIRSIVAEVGNEAPPPPRPTSLSDGDVLCAWWTRHLLAARLPYTARQRDGRSRQTVCVMNMMGLGDLLRQSEELLVPAAAAERKSSAVPVNTMPGDAKVVGVPDFYVSEQLPEELLGEMAGNLRQAIQELGTRPQVEALLKLKRAAAHGNKMRGRYMPALFGDGGMHVVICTNWLADRFFDLDFSAAIMPPPPEKEKLLASPPRVAKPTNVQMHTTAEGMPAFLMSPFSILGRDEYGNFWIRGTLREEYWPKVEHSLLEEVLLERVGSDTTH